MEKKKLKISDLKVRSFVTALDGSEKQTVLGGGPTNGTGCQTQAAFCQTQGNACFVMTDYRLCGTCPISTCAATGGPTCP